MQQIIAGHKKSISEIHAYLFGVGPVPDLINSASKPETVAASPSAFRAMYTSHAESKLIISLLVTRIVSTAKDIGGCDQQRMKRELAACVLRDIIDTTLKHMRFNALMCQGFMVRVSKGIYYLICCYQTDLRTLGILG